MDDLNTKISYLRGLTEGLGINDQTNEGRVILNIIDILDEIADAITELDVSQAELDDYVETIDEDLSEIEDHIYGKEEKMDYADNPQYVEVECPHCHETVYFDDDIFDEDEDVLCPNCHSTILSDEASSHDEE